MIDLSQFSDTCAYCYNGIKEGVAVCKCGLTVCMLHNALHYNKNNCSSIYSLSYDENEVVKVTSYIDTGDLQERINIKIKNGMPSSISSKECMHIYHSKNIAKEFTSDQVKCDNCKIGKNVWICLECGNIGCGRQQEGIEGNGHALQHFKDFGHSQCVLASSIIDGIGETFCYLCDDFVQNPLTLLIEIKNNEIQSFEEITESKADQLSVKSSIIGIVNEGVTCYISAALHLLNELLKNYDLSDHFDICLSNPMQCICCQLIKIFNESQKVDNEIRAIRIVGFLKCLFQNTPLFSVKKQEDCSEFLNYMLETLKNYESCMLFPPVSESFEHSITGINECKSCGITRETVFKGTILYLPFEKSIEKSVDKYFECSDVPCECGQKLTYRSYFNIIPQFLIVSVGRYFIENGVHTKIEDPIDITDFNINCIEDGKSKKVNLSVKGSVIHKGKETINGHYTWWTKDKDGCFVADDSTIIKSSMECAQEATIFLLSSSICDDK